jgi:acetyltransferase-like isoleucine patch superfamily enzyme
MRFGNGVIIGPHCTVAAAESLVMEDNVGPGAMTLVTNLEHSKDEHGEHETFEVSGLKTSPVRIGEGTVIAQRSAVLRGSNIGKHCFIGTNSVVQGDIPDYSIVVGAPGKVVGRTHGR